MIGLLLRHVCVNAARTLLCSGSQLQNSPVSSIGQAVDTPKAPFNRTASLDLIGLAQCYFKNARCRYSSVRTVTIELHGCDCPFSDSSRRSEG